MCGIFCVFSNTQNGHINLLKIFEIFKKYVIKRGPDSLDVTEYSVNNYNLLFAASVLWLQGKSVTKQPLEDNNSIFVYNGDIFEGLPDNLRNEVGDTKLLFEMIKDTDEIYVSLSKIQGPYGFIYFDKQRQKLYFGRDVYGRRSLLIGKSHSDILVITSVAKRTLNYSFIELPSIGTFCLDIKLDKLSIIPWQYQNQNFNSKLEEMQLFLNRQIFVKHKLTREKQIEFIEPNVEQLHILNQIKNLKTETVFETLIKNEQWLNKILKLQYFLEEAIRKRISSQPRYCKNCLQEKVMCNHSLVGILFSGGVDCAVLAVLADKIIDKNRPIDLINVAFDEGNKYVTPDRITALKTLDELKKINPKRQWNFFEINIPQKELNEARKQHIADLIYPLQTVLDDSLGCALWFASKAEQVTEQGNITSACRVLLVGMGADELFGGYTRHRAAFKKQSWLGLHSVLNEDWQNLSHRNLARDDRVISDHGRQLRTPYLDENVVNFIRSLNTWEKTFPSDQISKGLGEKILLRSLAYYIGLKNSATFKKRALQFGSRIANKKENAHEVSSRLSIF